MRLVDFTDGFTSGSEPTKGTLDIGAYQTFADTAAYVSNKGAAAADGDVFYDTTLDVVRVYENGSWVNHDIGGFSPLTTKGDIMTYSTANVRLAVGTDGKFLKADSAEATGMKWDTVTADQNSPVGLQNLGVSSSVGASALTIALKQSDGTSDASVASPVKIGVRNSTATNGGYNLRPVTGALSVTVPSGATLGNTDGDDWWIYIYALDNSGTIELAVSASSDFDNGRLQSTTALSAGADSAHVLYSTTSRSNVPVRLIGRGLSNQTTAGTWGNILSPIAPEPSTAEYVHMTPGSGNMVVVAALIDNAGTPSVTSQTGDWITSITDNALGDFTINIKSGIFGSAPYVTVTTYESTIVRTAQIDTTTPVSTSAIRVLTGSDTGVPADHDVFIMCVGAPA